MVPSVMKKSGVLAPAANAHSDFDYTELHNGDGDKANALRLASAAGAT